MTVQGFVDWKEDLVIHGACGDGFDSQLDDLSLDRGDRAVENSCWFCLFLFGDCSDGRFSVFFCPSGV